MIIYYIPLHKRQCLVTIIFTNLPSLLPLSFHEMIYIYIYNYTHRIPSVLFNDCTMTSINRV